MNNISIYNITESGGSSAAEKKFSASFFTEVLKIDYEAGHIKILVRLGKWQSTQSLSKADLCWLSSYQGT
jgi:hypothetical protein